MALVSLQAPKAWGDMKRKTITRILIRALGILLGVLALVWLGFAFIKPSSDRNWIPDHAVMAVAELSGDMVTIRNIRNFQKQPDGTTDRSYYDKTYDLGQVESLWYALAIFHQNDWRGPAHSMFSFGFADGSFLVVSVEARKEVGESYSIWQGLIKKYEVIYVLGDERDLILNRAAYLPDDVYLYPIKTSPGKIRELLTDMLVQANDLAVNPEFYNTLTNNCTTKLRDHVNKVAPGLVPLSWKVQLPGYSDELAQDLGLIDTSVSIEEARQLYWINERAERFAGDPDFSLKIRPVSLQAVKGKEQ